MLNTRVAPAVRMNWPPDTTGLHVWPDRSHHGHEIVHGHKPGDEYMRVAIHRHHRWSRPIRHAAHVLAGFCPMV